MHHKTLVHSHFIKCLCISPAEYNCLFIGGQYDLIHQDFSSEIIQIRGEATVSHTDPSSFNYF